MYVYLYVYVYMYVLVAFDEVARHMDNVSDHNRFNRSRIKLAKNMLIEAKRYIGNFPVNGFAHKCNRGWTKPVYPSFYVEGHIYLYLLKSNSTRYIQL